MKSNYLFFEHENSVFYFTLYYKCTHKSKIRVITKLPNSEESYKGKVKTQSLSILILCYINVYINDRESRRDNQKWTTQRNWQHRVHKMRETNTQTHHNMHCTPLHANKPK
jgi:hypothetical protein